MLLGSKIDSHISTNYYPVPKDARWDIENLSSIQCQMVHFVNHIPGKPDLIQRAAIQHRTIRDNLETADKSQKRNVKELFLWRNSMYGK